MRCNVFDDLASHESVPDPLDKSEVASMPLP